MAIELTLNDFRNVLGNVNDGNIVLNADKTGIEKANYGNKFLNMFRSVRTAPNNPEENMQVRQSLLTAIRNSAERKVLSFDDMQRIYDALGISEGINVDNGSAPLTRMSLKCVFDIIDGATKDDTLINSNMEALASENLLNRGAANSVKQAMDGAACFSTDASAKERIAQTGKLFGADFNGRSPAEVDKFVHQNMAVIREQVFDRLYWAHPALSTLTIEEMSKTLPDMGGAGANAVSEEKVSAAFKEVVGDLMSKFAANKPVVTKFDTLAQMPAEANIVDKAAQSIWKNNVDGPKYELTIGQAFNTVGLDSDVFTTLQLKTATQAVVNQMREKFNALYKENHFNAQDTEKAFKREIEPLMDVLKAAVADMNRLEPEAAALVKAKIADAIGTLVVEKRMGASQLNLADAVLKALNDTVKPFSSRGMVEDFVNANFAYLEDKSPVINFFMEKIALAGEKGGIDQAQAAALTKAQNAVFGGNFDADAKRSLEFGLLNPLKEAYAKMVESQDPEKIAALRATRNANTFKALLEADPEYAKLDDGGKAEAFVKLKVRTLLGARGYEFMYKNGITANEGSQNIRTNLVNDKFVPVQEALDKLDEELKKLDDRELDFFSQYAAKGLRDADSNLDSACTVFELGSHPSIFKDALQDGTVSISSIPKNAVPVLSKAVEAQLLATTESQAHTVVGLKDILPRGDAFKEIGSKLFDRMKSRFDATGIKPVPDRLAPLEKPGDKGDAARRLGASSKDSIMRLRGFGTIDPARILKLVEEVGIDLSTLDGNDDNAKVDTYEKLICLSTIAAMSSFKLDGLPEFTQRVFGKPFAQVTLSDVFKVLHSNKMLSSENIAVKDPINGLSGAQKTAKELFAGEIVLSGANLSPQETTGLLKAARDLSAAKPGTEVALKVAKADVTMTRLADGALSLKIGGMPLRAAFDANGLVRMIENEVVSKPGSFAPEVVKSALPPIADVENGRVPLARARELYAKVAAAKTGTLPVMFSAYTTAELRDIAVKSVDGQFTTADLSAKPPATYNSGAMIEMHAAMERTSAAEVDAKVKIASHAQTPIAERRVIAPKLDTVKNIVADLFLNKDTWAFDESATGKAKPGERVRKLLVEYEPELVFILNGLGKEGEDLLAGLPANVREAVKDVFADIKSLGVSRLSDPSALPHGAREALAAIEAKIDGVADALVNGMQAKVTALFEPHGAAEAKENWQKTFSELTGKEGIDESTRQGKFTMKVLRNYFANSAQVDKRAMLSALIRNTDSTSSDAKQVAELLKGAGPLLQKMLQGLPLSSFDPDTQLALKDMKSRLLPIPDEAVKAQLLELVNSSNGNILSIEVKKSLGAASVGQAFLCTIKTKEHPYIGEECVIKLLRPNVDTAIQREKSLIDSIVGDDAAMKSTFDGQYRKILEEFDLTLESTNVGIGTKVYEQHKGVATVHSMQTLEGSQSTMTSMILKRADGNTFDNLVESARKDADEILAPLRRETEVDGKTKVVYKADNITDLVVARRKIIFKAAQLNDRRNQVLDIAKAWFDNALFGNGFFHGDLHGGNLMTGPTGTTFIDFGNCSRLNSKDQLAVKMMLAAVVSGDTSHVVMNFKKLMPPDAAAMFSRVFVDGGAEMKSLTDVLSRGSSLDLMSRVQAFIAIVQSKDVPVPAPLQNFVQSYVRLCDIVDDIDRTVADLQIAANSIYCDVPEIAPAPGEPKTFALIKSIAAAYVGNADSQCSPEAIRSAGADFAKWAASDEGKAEIRSLSHDPARIKNELAPFFDKVKEVGVYGRLDSDFNPMYVGQTHAFLALSDLLSVFDDVEKAGKIQDGKIVSQTTRQTSRHGALNESELFDMIEQDLLKFGNELAEDYVEKLSPENPNGESIFMNISTKVEKSVTDICSDVIGDNSDSLAFPALSEYKGDALKFRGRLEKAAEEGGQKAIRMKNTGTVLAEKNLALPPGERLSGQEMATLSRATSAFLVPLPRPDNDPKWGSVPAKRAAMLDAIAYNLSRAAKAMNLGEGEQLSNAAVSHATLNMGLLDKQLVKSILALSENDYNALVLDAQTAGKGLPAAVGALRDASKLLTKVERED